MTLVVSEISDLGVFMAADSAELDSDTGEVSNIEVRKIHYWKDINVGLSTWGSWSEEETGMNVDSFVEVVHAEFMERDNKPCSSLLSFADYLAERLNSVWGFDGCKRNVELYTGFHLCGYSYPEEEKNPGFCNVFIEKNYTGFEAQKTCPVWAGDNPYRLINGSYAEYVQVRNLFKLFEQELERLLRQNLSDHSDPDVSVVDVRAERLGNVIRQVAIGVRHAGLIPFIGGNIIVLYFDKSGNSRRYYIPVIHDGWPDNE